MAVKKATTKKAVKKAPVKKAVVKKAVVKKAVVKKAVAKKAPVKKVAKKAVAKKAVAKKAPVKKAVVKKATVKKSAVKTAPVKKVAKKAVAKKTTVRSASGSTNSTRQVFDSLAPIPELNVAATSARSEIKRAAQPAATPSSQPVSSKNKKSGKGKNGAILLVAALLFGGVYLLVNRDGQEVTAASPVPSATPSASASPEPSEEPAVEPTPTESASLEPVASTGTVRAAYLYTSTGIRLSWNVNGAEVQSVEVSASEDGKDFASLATLTADDRALRITKIDTKGLTKFRVTVTPKSGESFSSTISLRGRFTL